MQYAKLSCQVTVVLASFAGAFLPALWAVDLGASTVGSQIVAFFDPPPKITATASGNFCAGQGQVDATVSNLDDGAPYQIYIPLATPPKSRHEHTIRGNSEGQGSAQWSNLSASTQRCQDPDFSTGHLTVVVTPANNHKPGQESTTRIPFPAW